MPTTSRIPAWGGGFYSTKDVNDSRIFNTESEARSYYYNYIRGKSDRYGRRVVEGYITPISSPRPL